MNNAKKQRKTIEWERLEISSRKLKRSGNISCKDGQIDGGKVEIVTDFIFLGSKITVDSDCNHEIKRCLLLERKAMKNLDSILKSRDISLLTKPSSQSYGFSSSHVQIYGHDCPYVESWTIKKAEH